LEIAILALKQTHIFRGHLSKTIGSVQSVIYEEFPS